MLVLVSLAVGLVLLVTAFRTTGTSFTISLFLGALLVLNACARLWIGRMKRRRPGR